MCSKLMTFLMSSDDFFLLTAIRSISSISLFASDTADINSVKKFWYEIIKIKKTPRKLMRGAFKKVSN